MTIPAILPIVEGKSEIGGGIRRLLDRLLYETMLVTGVQIAPPFRVQRYKVVKENELEKAIKQFRRDREEKNFWMKGFIVLLDADDDCPVELGHSLCERARRETDLPVAVAIADKAIECWLLGAKESLGPVCCVRVGAAAPDDPEAIRGPKGHLSNNMEGNRRYSETADLPALLGCMDIDLCLQRCRSFEKFIKEVDWLVQQIRP